MCRDMPGRVANANSGFCIDLAEVPNLVTVSGATAGPTIRVNSLTDLQSARPPILRSFQIFPMRNGLALSGTRVALAEA